MLYLATFEPLVSACALADQIGSTYQVAPTNGLSKRLELELEVVPEELVDGAEDVVEVFELVEALVATEVLVAEAVVATEVEVFELVEVTVLEEVAQALTTP